MSDDYLRKTRCDRCGGSLSGGRTMSMFDTATICLVCKGKERQHPDYRKALEADRDAIRHGEVNFKGIGWKK